MKLSSFAFAVIAAIFLINTPLNVLNLIGIIFVFISGFAQGFDLDA